MSSADRFAELFEHIRTGYRSGRLAHAHVLIGSPRGAALEFAENMIRLVLEDEDADVHQHPDVVWIEPEKRSRQIGIEQVRDANRLISQKSFAGGWKVVVFLFAERITEQGSNALLKTLEEPPARSLLLLLSDSPQSLLATIASRCQRIDIGSGREVPQGAWLPPLLNLLRESRPGALESLALSAGFKKILDAERAAIMKSEEDASGEDVEKDVMAARIEARVRQVRADILHVMTLWHRDVLALAQGGASDALHFPADEESLRRQGSGKSFGQLVSDLRAVADAARRMDRNVPDVLAFESYAFATATR